MTREDAYQSLRDAHIKAWGPGYGTPEWRRSKEPIKLMKLHSDVHTKFFDWRLAWWREIERAFHDANRIRDDA